MIQILQSENISRDISTSKQVVRDLNIKIPINKAIFPS